MSKYDTIEIAGVELNSDFPFMNAAGSVNGAGEENFNRDFMDVVRAPGGVVMIGSVTIPFKEGNEPKYGGPVYRHISETGLTYNSMGLPNLGIERFSQILPELVGIAHDHDKKLALSLAPLTQDPGKEWVKMAAVSLETGVDIIEFNAGCPNIFDAQGNPKTVLSLQPDVMGEALQYVEEKLGSDFAAGIKLSPTPVSDFISETNTDIDTTLIRRQAEVANKLKIVRYISYFNTFGGQLPISQNGDVLPLSVPGGAGGVSGPGVAEVAYQQTKNMLEYLNTDVDVVVAGGIYTGYELQRRTSLDPRIKLGSAVTALWQAPSFGAGITRIAQEYSQTL